MQFIITEHIYTYMDLHIRGRMHGQGLTRETGYNSVARSQVR